MQSRPDPYDQPAEHPGALLTWETSARRRTGLSIRISSPLRPAEHGRPRMILSPGEVKWDRVMDLRRVERLRRAQDLLAAKGFDTWDTVLTCYSGAGFDHERQAGQHHAKVS